MFDLFEENDDFAEEQKKAIKLSVFKRMIYLFSGHRRELIWAVVSAVLSTVFLAGLPLVFRKIIDDGITPGNPSLLLWLSLAYLGMLIFHRGFEYFQSLVVGSMGITIVSDLKKKLLGHVLSLSIRFFDTTETGKLISRIESDSQRMFMLFSSVGLQMFWAVLNIGVSLVVMFTVSVEFTLYVLLCAPLFIGSAIIVFGKMRPMFRKDRELYATITGFSGEHITAIPLLRNLGNLEWSRKKFAAMNREKTVYATKIESIEAVFWFIMFLTPVIVNVIILHVGAGRIAAGTMTVGTIWLFIQYVAAIIHPLIMISEQISELQKSMGAAERIFDLLDMQSEIVNPAKPKKMEHFESMIRFENVKFGYTDTQVLRGVTFEIPKGKSVAIVGATGAGKTTILSLLTRWYDVTSGRITIDGTDIRDFNQKDLAEKMSFVMQDIFLFPGTIRENLKALRSDITDDAVNKAIKSLDIEHIIDRFENGLDTVLVENGKNLSYGERQLLSFARALAFNPDILVIDEATSSVDPITEARVQASLNILLEGRTSVIIAHRLSTIIHADIILVMENGLVVEQGNHRELLDKCGMYAQLYKLQTGVTHYV
ncbi:MAG: ABC transporter ATP-binding protein [Ignavibacteria bacterium]|nr:ABC transporter ATP-binding protein [Ignavibacteria bacterium]